MTSMELVRSMGVGWNLGNSLDAHWGDTASWKQISEPAHQETLWGNPVTTREMLEFVKNSGFTTIRIPITWYIHTGEAPDYIIDEAWLSRVQELVDHTLELGMFAIINIHHDDYRCGEGWQNGWFRLYEQQENRPLTDDEKALVQRRLIRVWEQISERFKNHHERLIFEGINEPQLVNKHSGISREMWDEMGAFLNILLQSFIDTVRNSGGVNATRHLMVTPYFASVGMDADDADGRIAAFVDAQAGRLYVKDPADRLIVSLHYYEPWGFVLAPDDSEWFTPHFDINTSSIAWNVNMALRIFRENFIDRGIPIIMGETGAITRNLPNGEPNTAERVRWAEAFVGGLYQLGIPTIIWDDGGNFALLNRQKKEWLYPEITAALVRSCIQRP